MYIDGVTLVYIYIYILEWTRALNAREESWIRLSGLGWLLGGPGPRDPPHLLKVLIPRKPLPANM